MSDNFFIQVAVGAAITGMLGILTTCASMVVSLYVDHSAKILRVARTVIILCLAACAVGAILLFIGGAAIALH